MSNTASLASETLRRVRGGKYLLFFLGDQEYGFEILKVVEIVKMMPITPIRNAPIEIRGNVNLRTKLIPVLNLRTIFKIPVVDYTKEMCIIVVQTQNNKIGIIVDKVIEVKSISEYDIGDPPNFGNKTANEHILGIAKTDESSKLLLDIDSILSSIDLAEFVALENNGVK